MREPEGLEDFDAIAFSMSNARRIPFAHPVHRQDGSVFVGRGKKGAGRVGFMVAGIFVDSRASFEAMNRFIADQNLEPVIDRTFPFDQLPEALRHLESGAHFGKIVVTL